VYDGTSNIIPDEGEIEDFLKYAKDQNDLVFGYFSYIRQNCLYSTIEEPWAVLKRWPMLTPSPVSFLDVDNLKLLRNPNSDCIPPSFETNQSGSVLPLPN
jgi:hypothetical protein